MQRFLRSDSAAVLLFQGDLITRYLPLLPGSGLGSPPSHLSWPRPRVSVGVLSPGMTRHYQLERPTEARAQR